MILWLINFLLEDFMSKDSKFGQTAKILSFHPTGEYYYNKGLKAYHHRDLYRAKKFLDRALDLEPLEPLIACQLAIVCTDLGEYSYSNSILENIILNLDPHMTECHYFLANNYAHQGMFKEAYKHANEYLKKEKFGEFVDEAEDLMDLITFENNETEESLIEQDSLINEQEKAREFLEAGNFQKAVEVLTATIKDHPDFWFAYNNLALAHFYLGNNKEAFATLETVLEKNPGNLHALCNLVVFYYYEKNDEKVDEMVAVLEKVRPILPEQQYKLGATFALIGRYQLAYMWLRQLRRTGFEGDDTFYYWVSYCAHHLGYEHSAKRAWGKVLEMNPDKEGLEPWGEIASNVDGYEHQVPIIIKKLQSEFSEERLFGLFLYKHCLQKELIKEHSVMKNNNLFTPLEKGYADLINNYKGQEEAIVFLDQVAEHLYKYFQPISIVEAGVFVLWFSVFEEARKENIRFSNATAWASAVEYVWYKMKKEHVLQKDIAEKAGISVSTLQKYVKTVNSLLQ